MLRIMCYRKNETVDIDVPLDLVKDLIQDPEVLLWLDFEDTLPEQDEPILLQVFGFHPLAVEDALQQSHVPKLDDWEHYLYIVLHAITFDKEAGYIVETPELTSSWERTTSLLTTTQKSRLLIGCGRNFKETSAT